MSDVEFESENMPTLPTNDVIDVDLTFSNTTNEKYRAKEIEQLLKIQTDPNQYMINKNLSSFIKSDVWNTFGFPSKLQTNSKFSFDRYKRH